MSSETCSLVASHVLRATVGRVPLTTNPVLMCADLGPVLNVFLGRTAKPAFRNAAIVPLATLLDDLEAGQPLSESLVGRRRYRPS